MMRRGNDAPPPCPTSSAQRAAAGDQPDGLQMEPDGPRKRALEVSHSRVLLGASLFAVVFLVIAVRLVAVTLLPDGADAAIAPQPKIKTTDRADIVDRNGVVLATSLDHRLALCQPEARCRIRTRPRRC